MSARDWKRGDIAIVRSGWGARGPVRAQRVVVCGSEYAYWATVEGYAVEDQDVAEIRPLVVIDPESHAEVVRLIRAVRAHGYKPDIDAGRGNMQNALRSLIEVAKPDEPTGLGAVVEDADGRLYVRHDIDDNFGKPWCDPDGVGRSWANVDAVKVLSEGVTE